MAGWLDDRHRRRESPLTSMSAVATRILVAAEGDRAWFRVIGRATFAVANDFRAAEEALLKRGCRRFTVDLEPCDTLDSTFIGMMAGLARRLRGTAGGRVELANPSERLRHQIGGLGILPMFTLIEGEAGAQEFQAVEPQGRDKVELTRTSLEAHQTLMAVNPDNVAKFKDVAEFMAQELKELEGNPPAA
jgi:anti-anti-sigma regulatory factor